MPWKAWIAAIAIASVALFTGPAHAAPNVVHLNWGSQLNPSDCVDDGYRYLEVNVTQQVVNDADLAPAGNFWARLEYNRHIQVWKVGILLGERYCVLVHYQGSWTTIAGASPHDPGLQIPAGIEGTFQGGYRATIVGVLNESGNPRLRGRLAPVDRKWSGLPTTAPLQDDWINQYFMSVDFAQTQTDWWGWIYHGGPNSTFSHACDASIGPDCPGTSGNITD